MRGPYPVSSIVRVAEGARAGTAVAIDHLPTTDGHSSMDGPADRCRSEHKPDEERCVDPAGLRREGRVASGEKESEERAPEPRQDKRQAGNPLRYPRASHRDHGGRARRC